MSKIKLWENTHFDKIIAVYNDGTEEEIGYINDNGDINVGTHNTIRGHEGVPGTIRDLMIARARTIERILINEYHVNPNQIRVRVGRNNTSQTTEFIYINR